MIVKGKSITGRGLADHLLKPENDKVEVLEIAGICAADIHEAISILDAFAAGTKCGKPIYHAKINPAINDRAFSPDDLQKALSIVEENLGLTGQPRIIVKHEKGGREHYHAVYSRIDLENMQAISDSWNYLKHEKAAREIEKVLELEQTRACLYQREGSRPERTPDTADVQQAKKHGQNAKAIKAEIRAMFEASGNGQEFKTALEAAGFTLARGDSRDFVVIDANGETHTARATGAKAAELRAFMADVDRATLPSATEAKEAAKHRTQEAERKKRDEDGTKDDEPEPERPDVAAVKAWKAAFKRKLAEGRAAPAPTLAPVAEGQAAALGYLAALAEAQNERAAQWLDKFKSRADVREGFDAIRDETTERQQEGGHGEGLRLRTATQDAGPYLALCRNPLSDLRLWLDTDGRTRGKGVFLPTGPGTRVAGNDGLRPLREADAPEPVKDAPEATRDTPERPPFAALPPDTLNSTTEAHRDAQKAREADAEERRREKMRQELEREKERRRQARQIERDHGRTLNR